MRFNLCFNLCCTIVLFMAFAKPATAQKPFFPTLVADKWAYIDLSGNVALQLDTAKYAQPQVFKENLAGIQDKKTQLFGYINEKGAWAIPPKFTGVDTFNDALAKVSLDCDAKCLDGGNGLLLFGYTAIIDKTGKIVLTDNAQDPDPNNRFWFDDYNQNGLLRVEFGVGMGGIKSLMNRKGEMIGIRSNGSMGDFVLSDGAVVYNRSSGNYYTDAKGKKIMDLPNSGSIAGYSEGYAWLTDTTGAAILLNKKGKPVLTLDGKKYWNPTDVSESVFAATEVAEDGTNIGRQFYTIDGKPFLDKKFETAEKFSNGLAFVTTKDFNGYINKKGEPIATIDFPCPECKYGEFTKEGYAILSSFDSNTRTMIPYALVLRNGTVVFRHKAEEE